MRISPQSFLRQPLSAVFANPANVRILRALVRHGGELSAPLLAELSRMTKPSVLGALECLGALGYVESVGSGRQRLHRIDDRQPLLPALAALFAAEDRRFESVIESVRAAAVAAGATAGWLYGSVARGEDRPDSDLDVAIFASCDAGSAKMKMREALREAEDRLRFTASVLGLGTPDILRL